MAHVLQPVQACLHYTQYLTQYIIIHNYKLYLNTVYNCLIIICTYMLPILLYPKHGKNTYF